MKSIGLPALLALLLSIAACAPTAAPAVTSSPSELPCTAGPLDKTFGKTQWLVYGCDDGRSLAIVSAPGNPAMPFYFFFSFDSDGMGLQGEGTGNKQATGAAFEELNALTEADVAAIFQQAKAVTADSGG